MRRAIARWLHLLLLCSLAAAADKPASQHYLATLQNQLAEGRRQIPAITASAEEAAKRVVAGGQFWVGGSQPEFAREAVERAAGLMGAKSLAADVKVNATDVVLLGSRGAVSPADEALAKKLQAGGAYVIVFAASASDEADATIACGTNTVHTTDKKDIPTDTVINLINLWAWTGEFTAACTRAGKVPTFYISYWLPGGREWATRHRGQMFHQDINVALVKPGVLASQYLDRIDKILIGITEQRDQLKQAAKQLQQTPEKDRELGVMAHIYPDHFTDPRAPQPFRKMFHWQNDEPRKTKCLLFLGYQTAPEATIATTPQKHTIYTTVRPSTQPAQENLLYLNPHFPIEDGCCQLPNYPYPILPSSAIAQAAIYWSILSELDAKSP